MKSLKVFRILEIGRKTDILAFAAFFLSISSLVYQTPERRHCSRNPKWGPSDIGCKKLGDGHGLRRPAFVLRPSRRALRSVPGLPQ